MIGSNGHLAAVLAVQMFGLLAYNYMGMHVTGNLGAVFRTVLETMRTLFVWLLGLLLFYLGTGLGEKWTQYSSIQAAGFAVLVLGTVVYGRGDESAAKLVRPYLCPHPVLSLLAWPTRAPVNAWGNACMHAWLHIRIHVMVLVLAVQAVEEYIQAQEAGDVEAATSLLHAHAAQPIAAAGAPPATPQHIVGSGSFRASQSITHGSYQEAFASSLRSRGYSFDG